MKKTKFNNWHFSYDISMAMSVPEFLCVFHRSKFFKYFNETTILKLSWLSRRCRKAVQWNIRRRYNRWFSEVALEYIPPESEKQKANTVTRKEPDPALESFFERIMKSYWMNKSTETSRPRQSEKKELDATTAPRQQESVRNNNLAFPEPSGKVEESRSSAETKNWDNEMNFKNGMKCNTMDREINKEYEFNPPKPIKESRMNASSKQSEKQLGQLEVRIDYDAPSWPPSPSEFAPLPELNNFLRITSPNDRFWDFRAENDMSPPRNHNIPRYHPYRRKQSSENLNHCSPRALNCTLVSPQSPFSPQIWQSQQFPNRFPSNYDLQSFPSPCTYRRTRPFAQSPQCRPASQLQYPNHFCPPYRVPLSTAPPVLYPTSHPEYHSDPPIPPTNFPRSTSPQGPQQINYNPSYNTSCPTVPASLSLQNLSDPFSSRVFNIPTSSSYHPHPTTPSTSSPLQTTPPYATSSCQRSHPCRSQRNKRVFIECFCKPTSTITIRYSSLNELRMYMGALRKSPFALLLNEKSLECIEITNACPDAFKILGVFKNRSKKWKVADVDINFREFGTEQQMKWGRFFREVKEGDGLGYRCNWNCRIYDTKVTNFDAFFPPDAPTYPIYFDLKPDCIHLLKKVPWEAVKTCELTLEKGDFGVLLDLIHKKARGEKVRFAQFNQIGIYCNTVSHIEAFQVYGKLLSISCDLISKAHLFALAAVLEEIDYMEADHCEENFEKAIRRLRGYDPWQDQDSQNRLLFRTHEIHVDICSPDWSNSKYLSVMFFNHSRKKSGKVFWGDENPDQAKESESEDENEEGEREQKNAQEGDAEEKTAREGEGKAEEKIDDGVKPSEEEGANGHKENETHEKAVENVEVSMMEKPTEAREEKIAIDKDCVEAERGAEGEKDRSNRKTSENQSSTALGGEVQAKNATGGGQKRGLNNEKKEDQQEKMFLKSQTRKRKVR